MKVSAPLVSLIAVIGLSLAAPTPGEPSRALYFLNSNPEGASVVSFGISKDGSLGKAQSTSTGGLGLIGQNANGLVAADPLFSQGSIVVNGNRLFTVNAGSNTLASFHIPYDDPTHPVLVGKPVDTVGKTPNTVAYSEKNKLACVANTGSKPGLQCFKISECNGQLEPHGGFKPLPVRNQTNPIMGAANTVSQVLFNPSETAVVVVIKGNGMEDGFVYAYRIEDGYVHEEPVRSRTPGVPTTFGFSFVSDSLAVIASPAIGAVFVTFDESLAVTASTPVNVPEQSATCWTIFSPERNSIYLLDAGVADLTTLSPESRAISSTVPGFEGGMGNFDGVIGGNKLYALQREPAIAIFDLEDRENGPDVHSLEGLGDRASFIGMAVYYPSNEC